MIFGSADLEGLMGESAEKILDALVEASVFAIKKDLRDTIRKIQRSALTDEVFPKTDPKQIMFACLNIFLTAFVKIFVNAAGDSAVVLLRAQKGNEVIVANEFERFVQDMLVEFRKEMVKIMSEEDLFKYQW